MAAWKVWLRCLGEAVWYQTPKALVGLLPFGERIIDLAADFRERLRKSQPAGALPATLIELVTVSATEVQAEAQHIAAEVAPGESPDVQQKLAQYLQMVPQFTQQSLRRPEDPSGTTVPPLLAFDDARDLVPFIPPAPPRFQPGDAPPSLHGWVLVKRLGAGGFGEVWQVRHPHAKNVFAAVKFCLNRKARDVLLHEKHVIDQVMSLGSLPTIVPLLDFDLESDPPYLKYQFVPGGDLLEFTLPFSGVKATAVIRNLADTVGRFHRLDPPVVHRDLKPSNILVVKEPQPDGSFRPRLLVADFGIGGAALALDQERVRTLPSAVLPTSLLGSHTALYASKQQKQGARPDPRDDVFALGVLWYQLLIGDLTSERPAGKWRKKVAAIGLSEPLTDLLESCCDDDPIERPKDALEMAEQIAVASRLTAPPPPLPPQRRDLPPSAPPVVGPVRTEGSELKARERTARHAEAGNREKGLPGAGQSKQVPHPVQQSNDSPRTPATPSTQRPSSALVLIHICLVSVGLLALPLGITLIMESSHWTSYTDLEGRWQSVHRTDGTQEGFGIFFCVLGSTAEVVALVLFLIWLYRAWRIMPPEHDGPPPGQAAGLLLVPLFNFYWVYRVVPGLSTALRRALQARGAPPPHGAGFGVGLAACILLPTLYLTPVSLILFPIWLHIANRAKNRLLQQEPSPASTPGSRP